MVVRRINQGKCIKCFKCYDLCPMDVFAIEENYVKIKYQDDCQSCFLCVFECPSHAIYIDPERAVEIFDVYNQEI